MTVDAMSSLPMQAGSALAAAAGRTAQWAMAAYMRAPLRNTAISALVVLSAMAGSNVLYRQAHHHPAPLFGSFSAQGETAAKSKPALVTPVTKPKTLTKKVSTETTGSISANPAVATAPNNDDVRAVQQQLKLMNFFTGTVDGLFGPRTSKAIRAFEAEVGRTPRGQLTPEIVALIKGAQLPATPPAPKEATTTQPTAAPTLTVATADPTPTAEVTAPLPSPAPLTAADASPSSQLALANQDEPAAVDVDEDTTTNSTGTEDVAMTAAPTVAKRTVQTIAVRATTSSADDMPAPLDATPAVTAEATDTDAVVANPSMDSKIVTAVQRGLNSLGFLHGEITGEADEATSKAIRNFEVYYNYTVTGRVTQSLVKMLVQAGAVI